MRHSALLPLLSFLVLCAAVPAAQASSLAGTGWVMSSAGKRAPFVLFQADGAVAGSGGCNRFFGSYEQKDEALTFSALGATRMACPPDVMKAEQSFFEMLANVRQAKVEGSSLLLFDGAGKELARLSRRSGA